MGAEFLENFDDPRAAQPGRVGSQDPPDLVTRVTFKAELSDMVESHIEHADENLGDPHGSGEDITMTEQLTLFSDFQSAYTPRRPLCSNSKGGEYHRREKAVALREFAFVEANPACLRSLLVLDCDHEQDFIYENYDLPAPTYRVTNPFTEHFHAVYALATPVILTDAARRPPVNFLARVETGLTRAFEADNGYSGRITRNPLTGVTRWGINDEHSEEHMRLYGLKELASALDQAKLLPGYADKKAILGSTVGRNVALFDMTRKWGYRAVKRYWSEEIETWNEVVHAYAVNKNLGYIDEEWGTPLPENEVKHLAKSISKWIWTRFNENEFSQIQRERVTKRHEQQKKLLKDALVEVING